MTVRRKKAVLAISFFAIFIFLIYFSSQCIYEIRNSLKICITILIPSLFPYLVCSKVCLKLGIANCIEKLFDPITRVLFNVPGCSITAFLFGSFGGYPIGAKIVSDLYSNNRCTKSEAERMITFCNNSGPVFIIVTIGIVMYNSFELGFILFASHILGSLITGILFRNHTSKDGNSQKVLQTSRGILITKSTTEIITESISESVLAILNLCGCVIFFSAIINIVKSLGIIDIIIKVLSYFKINSVLTDGILTGFLEITQGIDMISHLNSKIVPELCAISFLLSWSGISIILQVISQTAKYRLSKSVLFTSKLMHSLISGSITFILCLLYLHLPHMNLTILTNSNFSFIRLLYYLEPGIISLSLFIILPHLLLRKEPTSDKI